MEGNMKELVDVLIKVLDEEVVVYSKLLKNLDEKTQVLVDGDIKKLDEITKEEQSITETLVKLENLREKVLFNIAHKKEKSELDVSQILEFIEGQEKEILEEKRNKLVNILEKIKEKNVLNSRLIKDSLDYINLNIDLFTNRDSNLTYGKGKKNEQTASFFNKQA
ncbi:flagellar protein FlgN [Senegalia massiliensis]|uniref:Flagellar protein FlgN n=2 Tax=Senegalia massiliensis TaxID=1720316 RepID=A0A845QYL0_9CLOT|nr:flagellar protein FlgN [Senegalia massiliensis]